MFKIVWQLAMFMCISFASVQHYFQIVPLCNVRMLGLVCYNSHNNNISKQVHMALEHGLFNEYVKVSLYFKKVCF